MSSKPKGKVAVTKKGKAPVKTPAKPAAQAAGSGKSTKDKPSEPQIFEGLKCTIRDADNVLVKDHKGEIKKSGRWALLVDTNDRVVTFLRYRDANYLCTASKKDMEPNTIRQALIGSIRFGKPFIIDVLDTDMLDYVKTQLDTIQPNLANDLFSKEILANENYLKLVRDEDGELYSHNHQFEFKPEDFSLIIASSREEPLENLLRTFFPVRIE